MKLLIFIPARRGNKKSENKNLYKLNRVSLLEYTISLANKLKKEGKIFISSDHKTILNKYKKFTYGYVRPNYLTKTGANVVDSIIDAVKWFSLSGQFFDTVLLLPPTSPLRKVRSIKKALKIFEKGKNHSLVSALHMREHPSLCVAIKKRNKWNYLLKKNSQLDFDKLEKRFLYIDGNFSIAKIDFLKKYKNFLIKNKTKFFIQNRYVTIDVNEKADLPIAKFLIKRQ